MTCLYVTEQGAVIRKAGLGIVVEKDDQKISEIETHRLNSVLLFGNIQVTTQALRLMLEQGIELALLSESGKIFGQLTPPQCKNILLRLKQYQKCTPKEDCLNEARSLVYAKLTSSAEVLKQLLWNRPELEIKNAIADLERIAKTVVSAKTSETLNGIEGNGARVYFEAYGKVFKDTGLFCGRSKRPPRDPANALLSFGYVLMASSIQSYLDAAGLDPYLGFYHCTEYGRPSLALDILEVFRAAFVDRFVVKSFNLGIFNKDDFNKDESGGFRLNESALKRFFVRWEENLEQTSFRKVLSSQTDNLKRLFLNETGTIEFYTFRAR